VDNLASWFVFNEKYVVKKAPDWNRRERMACEENLKVLGMKAEKRLED